MANLDTIEREEKITEIIGKKTDEEELRRLRKMREEEEDEDEEEDYF